MLTPSRQYTFMKKPTLLILAILLALSVCAQQDSQFSQYIFNGIHINPAYAGYKEDLYVQSFYRSQWAGVKGAPKSFSIAADGAIREGDVGLGLIVSNDQIGAQNYLTAYANYAYRIRTGSDEMSRLSFGIAVGVMQLGLDANKLEAINPGDNAVPLASQSTILPDARFGIYYSEEKYFAGFSVTNLFAKYAAKIRNSNLLVPQPHFYLTGGAIFPLNEDLQIKPVVLLQDDTKGPTSVDLNAFLLIKERIWLGTFYRTSVKLYQKNNLPSDLPAENAAGIIVELFATPNLRIGYSYDYSLGNLRSYNYGSHEISAGFYLGNKNSKRNRAPRCYQF
ncbi:type IX secretion system PorP/SprF family membrane protein [Pedobacter nutrimenti]|uniref:Type IX secretion system PorP/SprF family membrane protein n=2 Tax=Pedobacter nutrimenti TaxID=1241337 RepID=A0A318UMQ3_9SPHI|nr:type IX secretion system PorP/SprF family membrane protein [Pedobacter nutrimenti]